MDTAVTDEERESRPWTAKARRRLPLDGVSSTQARFECTDSLLSEAAVRGFEYGYSLADPLPLTLWEAQFGDFAIGAQVIIDQSMTSALVKWQRMRGLVMRLPHGYEGQRGPSTRARALSASSSSAPALALPTAPCASTRPSRRPS